MIVLKSYLLIFYLTFSLGKSEPLLSPNKLFPPKSPLFYIDSLLSHCGKYKIDIRELTVLTAQKYFDSGLLTSHELTSCYLQRIKWMNPYLYAVIEVNPSALEIARKSDALRKRGIIRSSLEGIPFLVKDVIGTRDHTQTTGGTLALLDIRPKRDAEVIKRLRAAGAIFLGKSNLSMWTNFLGSNPSPNGWSQRGGQTRSPYLLTADPSGSSTGSAVGVSSNMAMVALGVETDGSIINPSSNAGVVGLKTSLGATSSTGVIPISSSQDVIGPITRTVSDAAILFQVISKFSPGHRNSSQNPNFIVGIAPSPFWNMSDTLLSKSMGQLQASLALLNQIGQVSIINIRVTPTTSGLLDLITFEAEVVVFSHEFKYGLNKYLQNEVDHFGSGLRINSLKDVIQFNKDHPLPHGYTQAFPISAEATDGIFNETYIHLRNQNKDLAQKYLDDLISENMLDAIASPCDSGETRLLRSIGAIAGYPMITIPSGFYGDGTPFGICFLGKANSEVTLLKIGSLLEKAGPVRKAPTFLQE